MSHDQLVESIAAVMKTRGVQPNRDALICTVHQRSGLDALSELMPDLALSVEEPWAEVGRVVARRLMSRIEGDDSQPHLTLVRPTIP